MQASAREQSRTVRRLRRLATAATNLAGAATTQAVLQVACVEACVIQEADGAIARWWMGDGSVVSAEAGQVDRELAETAFVSVTNRRPARGRGWVAYPLPSSDPWQHAALVVFVGDDFSTDEELVLSSLASLIPVAFERALGTEAAVRARGPAAGRGRSVSRRADRPPARDGAVTIGQPGGLRAVRLGSDETSWVRSEALRPPMIGSGRHRTAGRFGREPGRCRWTASTSRCPGAPMPAISPSDDDTVLWPGWT